MKSRRGRLACVAVVCLLAIASAGLVACGGKNRKPIDINPDYSVNVIPVPEFWPREDIDWAEEPAKRAVQEEVYARLGRPDFFRKVYTFDNRIIRPQELSPYAVLMGQRPTPLFHWVYIDLDKVITFTGETYKEEEISDQLRTVALHGDPNDIKNFPVDGIQRTSYYYFNHGKEFVFVNGTLTEERALGTAMPAHTRIR